MARFARQRQLPVALSVTFRSSVLAVPIVLVLSRLRRYSYSNPVLLGDVAVPHTSLATVTAHAQRFARRPGDYEYRFAEYEHEYDFARSIDARSWVGTTAGPTKTARFGHRRWSQIGSRLGRAESLVIGRRLRCPDFRAGEFARSKCCAVPCRRVSWRCGGGSQRVIEPRIERKRERNNGMHTEASATGLGRGTSSARPR
jgi:hypothetical protein